MKAIGMIVIVLLLILGIFIYWKYLFVFGEGTKSGQLNYLVRKGYLFKTYEGKLIQQGFRSKAVGTLESYTFEFSMVNEKIAQKLMSNSGKEFDLHYKEYLGQLPWRGVSEFVADSIISMKEMQ